MASTHTMSKAKTQNYVDPEVERIINDSFFYSNSKERFKILNTAFKIPQKRLNSYEGAQDLQSVIFPQEELTEVFLFSEVKPDKVNDICNSGIGCGNVLFSQIGDNKKGVCISRCADILDEENWEIGHVGVLVVYKCSLKLVKEIENDRCQVIPPSSGYNGHVSWNWRLYSAFKKTQPVENCTFGHYELYYASQYYLYEFLDENVEECVPDSTCIMYPKHVLPYAVVDFKYQASSILNIRSPSQCKPCFKVWEGDLVQTIDMSAISVCLKSFKHVLTPVALENFNVIFEPMDDVLTTFFPGGNITATSDLELDYFKMNSSKEIFKKLIASMKKQSEAAKHIISDQVVVLILPSCKYTINMAIESGKSSFCPESNLHCFILFKKPSNPKDRFNNLRSWKFKIFSPNNVSKIAESKVKMIENKMSEKENVLAVGLDEDLAMSPHSLPGLQPEAIDVHINASNAGKAASPQPILVETDVETDEEVIEDDFRLHLSSEDEDTVNEPVNDNEIDATPVRCEISALNTEDLANTVEELLSTSFVTKDDLFENVTVEDTIIKELVSELIDAVLLKEAERQEIQPIHLACQSSDPENDDFEMIMLTSVPNSKFIDSEHYSRGNWIKLKSSEDPERDAIKISFVKIDDKWMLKNGVNSTLAERSKQVTIDSKASNKKRKRVQPSKKLNECSATANSSDFPNPFLNFPIDQNKVLPLNKEILSDMKCSPIKTIVSSNLLPTCQSSFQVPKWFEFEGSFLSQKDRTAEFLKIFNDSAKSGSVAESGAPQDLRITSSQNKLPFLQATNLNNNVAVSETRIERTGEVQPQEKLELVTALDLSIGRNQTLIGLLNKKFESCKTKSFASGIISNKPNAENCQEEVANPNILKKLRNWRKTQLRGREAEIQMPKQIQKSGVEPNEAKTTDKDLDFSKNCMYAQHSKKVKLSNSAMTLSDQKTLREVPRSKANSIMISNNRPVTNKTQPQNISSAASTMNENLINGQIQRNGYPIDIPIQPSIISGEQNVNLRFENSHFANGVEQPRNYSSNSLNYVSQPLNYVANWQLSPYYRSETQPLCNNYFVPSVNMFPFQPISYMETHKQYAFQSDRFAIVNNNSEFTCNSLYMNARISQMCSSMVSPTTPSQQSPYFSQPECTSFSESDLVDQINPSHYSKANYFLDTNSPLSQFSPPSYLSPNQPPPPPTYPPPVQPPPPPPIFNVDERVVDDFNVMEMELDSRSQEDEERIPADGIKY